MPDKVLSATICGNIDIDDGDCYSDLMLDKQSIVTGNYSINYRNSNLMKKKGKPVPLEFTYGYAITAHKSQGSEWNKVLVFEEKFPFSKEEHKKWLYTACTRASCKLVLVRP